MAAAERQADKLINNQSQTQNFFCNIEIANTAIPPRNIQYLALREWALPTAFIPRLELSIMDDGVLTELKNPFYNQQIYLELGRTDNDDNPIELLFDIYDYSIDKVGDQSKNLIQISALISMTDPFVIPERPILYDQKTSKDICEELSKKLLAENHDNYSFESGNATPSDTMNWIQSYVSNIDFIKQVMYSSYISTADCALAYIDTKAKFHYNALLDKFSEKPNWTARFDLQMATSLSKAEMEKLAEEKGYTKKQANNDIWYSSINFRDYSGTIRNQIGFAIETTYFERAKSTYSSDVFSLNVNNTDADIYKNFINNKTYYTYSGAIGINEMGNNQNAKAIRANIIGQLFAQSVLLEINSFSDVKLLDTIDLKVNADIKDGSTGFPINEKLSGTYIVGGITHNVGGPGSLYKKIITLYRTGVNKVGFSGIGEQ